MLLTLSTFYDGRDSLKIDYMRLPWLIIAVCILGCLSEQEKLQRDLDRYVETFNSSQYEKMLDMLYPPYFDKFSREQSLMELKGIDEMYGHMIMGEHELVFVSEPLVYNDTIYKIIEFTFSVELKLSKQASPRFKYIREAFEDRYGEGNVHIDKRKGILRAGSKNLMVTISVDAGNHWYFLDHMPSPQGRTSSKVIAPNIFLNLQKLYDSEASDAEFKELNKRLEKWLRKSHETLD